MKKMTLDETWTNCLKMWRWIAKQRKLKPKISTEFFKEEWLLKHGFKTIDHDCFFCEYDSKYGDGCYGCPARKYDPEFHCSNRLWHWKKYPTKFYNKLVALNKIRLKKK